MPTHFRSCPIASRFIETREDALSYYSHRLVGDHRITTLDARLVVRFNPEEIHIFTDSRAPCPPEDVVVRGGASGERRCFCRERARLLDLILPTLRAPAVAHRALIPHGVTLYGPAEPAARRMCIVVAPATREAGVYFVRTAFPVSTKDFAAKLRSSKPAPWPPS